MWTSRMKVIAAVTAVGMAATAAIPLPAAAAPAAKPATAQTHASDGSTDFSGARRHRRGGNAAALAMFGVVAGTIATIAVAQERRKRERDYWRARYGYYGYPGYGYYAPRPIYRHPGYGYYGHPYPY